MKGYFIYFGYDEKENLVYIGTTVQNPKDRFRWHKHNGKDLYFEVIKECESANEMLDLEFELIKKHEPKLNKIKTRKQNLNIKLTEEELEKRKGNTEWCQFCLKRRVNKGYKFCSRCFY